MLADSIAQEVALRDLRVVRSVAKLAVDDYAQRLTRVRRSGCVRWPTWRNPSTSMETIQAALLIVAPLVLNVIAPVRLVDTHR